MLLIFKLEMPKKGSWNGKWTAEKPDYFIFRNVPKKQALEIVDKNFGYDFEDRWYANVSVTRVKKRTKTSGFRSYSWMVDEIIEFGRIKTRQERIKERQEKESS